MATTELEQGVNAFAAAAIRGEGFEQALGELAAGAGAEGAVLVRAGGGRALRVLSSPSLAEAVADYEAGRAPPDSRQVRVRTSHRDGFRSDLCDYAAEEIGRDPFYQEFLRPRGLYWHACAWLDGGDGEEICISFKRSFEAGCADRSEISSLDRVLPELRAATRIARRLLDATASGVAQTLWRRGGPVFQFDGSGRVISVSEVARDDANPIFVHRHRLLAYDFRLQPAIDAAVHAAVTPPARPGLVRVASSDGSRQDLYLQTLPVAGNARDVMGAAVACAVLIRPWQPSPSRGALCAVLADTFQLTPRECDVATRLADGEDTTLIAGALGLGLGTTRNYLKSVFAKLAVSRQAELVALIARLRP